MNNEVIFDVLRNVRFNVLGSVKLVTPELFSELDALDKEDLYDKMFDAHCSACEALSALMTIEKNYRQLESK